MGRRANTLYYWQDASFQQGKVEILGLESSDFPFLCIPFLTICPYHLIQTRWWTGMMDPEAKCYHSPLPCSWKQAAHRNPQGKIYHLPTQLFSATLHIHQHLYHTIAAVRPRWKAAHIFNNHSTQRTHFRVKQHASAYSSLCFHALAYHSFVWKSATEVLKTVSLPWNSRDVWNPDP